MMKNTNDLDHQHLHSPGSFGPRCGWFACYTTDSLAVSQLLGLQQVQQVSWKDGIAAAYRGAVFVTRARTPWVFAVSTGFPEPSPDNPHALTSMVARLGTAFPDVQFFATYRQAYLHMWARASHGQVIRQYGVCETGVFLDVGTMSGEEQALKAQSDAFNAEWDAEDSDGAFSPDPAFIPGESDVLALARAWSECPDAVREGLSQKSGYLGVLAQEVYGL